MNEALIYYDIKGTIIHLSYGAGYEPVGVPWMRVVVPEGQHIVSVDTTATPHKAVFEANPVPEIIKVYQDTNALKERLDYLEAAFNYVALS